MSCDLILCNTLDPACFSTFYRCAMARNGCDGRLMAKILITTIQVYLVPNPGGGNVNSPESL